MSAKKEAKYYYVYYIEKNIYIRDLPRFFDQVGQQTINVSIENKHFFTK